jgi:hypothetical protein
MPLTNEEIDRIARRVWNFVNPDITDRQAYWFLRHGVDGNPTGRSATPMAAAEDDTPIED